MVLRLPSAELISIHEKIGNDAEKALAILREVLPKQACTMLEQLEIAKAVQLRLKYGDLNRKKQRKTSKQLILIVVFDKIIGSE